mmetsp:Transcript_19434/g.54105  ORF Transcript_19434/g.54105 Transcript_19434/m.54105 type:complete len:208 (-) Transcript_19434:47-670(-)
MDTGAWNGSTPFRLDSAEGQDLTGGEVMPVDIPISGSLSPVHTSTAQEISGTISGDIDQQPVRSADSAVPVSGIGSSPTQNTIDEPVWDTVKRDLARVWYNIKVVLLPGYAQAAGNTKALKDWDLWGPLLFTLILAIALSNGNPKAGSIFSVVVLVVCVGAVVLTLNVVLLGGNIQFFQAVSLLGYCLFPLDVVAIISLFVSNWVSA